MRWIWRMMAALALMATSAQAQTPARLEGLAVLPAVSLVQPPQDAPAIARAAGAYALTGAAAGGGARHGVTLPLKGQAVQGVSALRRAPDGTFWALSDNGFGSQRNSADALLMLHRMRIDFARGGVQRLSTIFLSDPRRVAPFRIVAEGTRARRLTGADFDPESLVLRPDGGFWIGEEFGPALLAFDAEGRLEAVVEAKLGGQTLRGPDHWRVEAPAAPDGPWTDLSVRRSAGFEGLAAGADGRTLYAVLERSVWRAGAEERGGARVLEFDAVKGDWTGRSWFYPLDHLDHKIGGIAVLAPDVLVVIERDDGEGPDARYKRLVRARLDRVGEGVRREGFVDLLAVDDARAGAAGGRYGMPFVTIESVEPLGEGRFIVVNDNNLPFSQGRTADMADPTEFALIAAPDLGAAQPPLIIGHRGASGERPEHTLAAYALAIEQGADFIEPDLVMTKDGVLVARHENEISETTDVATRPEFAALRRTQTIDGEAVTGWFTEDLTLAELKSLRARERLPQLRQGNTRYDGQETIPTLEEVLALANAASARLGRRIGVYPETKHPSHFQALGLAMEPPLSRTLAKHGFDGPEDPVFIQSFETANLKSLAQLTRVRLVQLVAARGAPWDWTRAGRKGEYADMLTPEGLKAVRAYASGIGVEKCLILPRDAAGRGLPATDLVRRAHAAGLAVHAWTFRAENYFLPLELRKGDVADQAFPAQAGDLAGELRRAFSAGVDGVFTDHVAPARAVANEGRGN